MEDSPVSRLAGEGKGARTNSRFAVRDVSLHLFDIDFSNGTALCSSVHMDVHDVFGDSLIGVKDSVSERAILRCSKARAYSISSFVVLIFHDENHVET